MPKCEAMLLWKKYKMLAITLQAYEPLKKWFLHNWDIIIINANFKLRTNSSICIFYTNGKFNVSPKIKVLQCVCVLQKWFFDIEIVNKSLIFFLVFLQLLGIWYIRITWSIYRLLFDRSNWILRFLMNVMSFLQMICSA